MVYHDDPNPNALTSHGGSGGGGGGALEISHSQYRDTFSESDDGEYGIVPVQSQGSSIRCKVLLALSVLAVLAIGGGGLFSYRANQGEGNSDGSGGSSGSDVEGSGPRKGLFPGKVGVRDHSGSSHEEQPAVPQQEDEKPAEGECEDDPTYILSNLKTCASWIASVGRPALLNGRCNQYTGIYDNSGDELQVKHFCRLSCGMCGDASEAEEENYKNETPKNTNVNPYAAELDEMKDKEEEEFAKELEEMEVKGEVMIDKEEVEKDMTDEEKEEFEEEEEIEAEEQEDEDEVLWEVLKETENEGDEEEEEEEDGLDGEAAQTDFFTPLTAELDFFIPLTALEREAMKEKLRNTLRVTKNALVMASSLHGIPEDERDTVDAAMQHQRTFTLSADNPKQFMHLQNSQTGSDSIDGLIQCAVDRQNDMHGDEHAIIHQSICESTNLDSCLDELAGLLDSTYKNGGFYLNSQGGLKFDPADEKLGIHEEMRNACNAGTADVMSYGASLNAVRSFGWKEVDSIAMFANPVERIHRMYRLTAKSCYQCKLLETVLEEIGEGTFGREDGDDADTIYDYNGFCAVQMIGHQGTNLLTNPNLLDFANDVNLLNEKEIVEEAIRNLRKDITWIGLLDQMDQSVDGFREAFPWLSENLNGEALKMEQEFGKIEERIGADVNFGIPPHYIDQQGCVFEDRDEEPEYICGSRKVSEEALLMIKWLNTRDLAVYKAAQERFLLQREVIAEYRDALHLDN